MCPRSGLDIPAEIKAALRRRGLIPRDNDMGTSDLGLCTWPAPRLDLLYQQMHRYSFRLVLRDVIRLGQKGAFMPGALSRQAGLPAVQQHLLALTELMLVRPRGGPYELVAAARSLGSTLEWFVAQVLLRELGFQVAWGIPLRGGRTGGDLDVVALAEGMLLYVEVKSGPPKHLTHSQVSAFLDRVDAVAPGGAIFFEDTELRMADKIVVLFEEVLARREVRRRVQRLERELFSVGPGIYICNARPDVTTNLTTCISRLLRERGIRLDPATDCG